MKVFAVKRTCIVREGFALASARRKVGLGQLPEAAYAALEAPAADHPRAAVRKVEILNIELDELGKANTAAIK